MKTSHIFWGTLFIFLGLLVLLNNITPIHFNWGNLWQYWPLILVLFGIAMLIRNKLGKAVIAGLAAVLLAITLFTSVKLTSNLMDGGFQIIFDNDSDTNYTVTEYTELVNPEMKKASLIFDAGAGIFNIKNSTDDLIYVSTKGVKDNFNLVRMDDDDQSKINLKMKETTIHIGKSDYTNRVDIALNENTAWDLNLEVGAADINLDLDRFNIENIEIDMGAASLDLKLGEPAETTNLKLNAGASKIDIRIPESVGCQVTIDDVLSSKKLRKFDKLNSGLYETPGFEDSEKKIYMNIDCGVSSVTVRRYSD